MTTTPSQTRHLVKTNESTEISTAYEEHTWSSNYRLLRKLYPKWEPNDVELKEVWFRCFDKPNGLGLDLVAHDLLKSAIIDARQVNSWTAPNIEVVSKLYRRMRTERLMDLEKQNRRVDRNLEAIELQAEHERRIDQIKRWDDARRSAAIDLVNSRFPSTGKQTADPIDQWSHLMTGLVVAADKEIFLAK